MPAAPLRKRLLQEIRERGVLLVTDPALPSVTGFVAGEPVSGSWWSHPKAHEIYAVLMSLEEETDLLLVKLIAKKETFVHQSLWPDLLALATSNEPWQRSGLSARARALLEKVEASGRLRLEEVGRGFDRKALGQAARELEERLLVHGTQVHTATGAHQKLLSSWARVAASWPRPLRRVDPSEARKTFESRTDGKLPWQGR